MKKILDLVNEWLVKPLPFPFNAYFVLWVLVFIVSFFLGMTTFVMVLVASFLVLATMLTGK